MKSDVSILHDTFQTNLAAKRSPREKSEELSFGSMKLNGSGNKKIKK